MFHVDHSSRLNEEVLGESLGGVEGDTLVCEESLGEVVAVNYSENSRVDVEVDGDVEVLPHVVLALVFGVGQFVALQEHTLGHARILSLHLLDHDGVVIQVIVQGALADAIVLVGVFHHGFLEEAEKSEHL